jgi:creatinine amidohydrolase
MIRHFVLADTSWKNLKEGYIDLVVFPRGATEAHNYHLPYPTDVIEGTAIREESVRIAWGKRTKVIE